MKSTLLRLLFIVAIAVFMQSGRGALATPVPSWFNATDYDWVSHLALGRNDIDRVFDSNDPIVGGELMKSLNIKAGRGYYAWISADQDLELFLTSWTGFTPGPQGTQLLDWKKLDSDVASSPLGLFPALLGSVRSDGGLTLLVCGIQDRNCAYKNETRPIRDVNFTFHLKFAPELSPIPVPAAGILLPVGLSVLCFLGWRRREMNAADRVQTAAG